MNIQFGELRALLQQPASASGWNELCELVATPRWDWVAEQWLPYALDHLDRGWSDERRRWPLKWLDREPPWWATRMVRHLVFDDDTHARWEALHAQLASPAAPELGSLYISPLLGHAAISVEEAAALLTHEKMASLRTLRMGDAVCTPQTMALACALPLEMLMCYFKPEAVEALSAAFTPPATLAQLATPCASLEQLAALHMPALRELRLLCHHVTHAGIDAMVAAPWFAQLRYLNINTRFGRADSSPPDILERLRALGAKAY